MGTHSRKINSCRQNFVGSCLNFHSYCSHSFPPWAPLHLSFEVLILHFTFIYWLHPLPLLLMVNPSINLWHVDTLADLPPWLNLPSTYANGQSINQFMTCWHISWPPSLTPPPIHPAKAPTAEAPTCSTQHFIFILSTFGSLWGQECKTKTIANLVTPKSRQSVVTSGSNLVSCLNQ